jgi:methyltransferase (TIGR00027 family)
MAADQEIHHISDTAMWIAAYRAQETERPDAVFRDPLAKKLAGSRGFKILETTPHTERMAFAMVARTSAIDRLVNSAVHKNIDTIINLGAGLDTRPYRIDLPLTLNWVEVDFPNMIRYKNELLQNEKPRCRLTRIASDLSDAGERKTLFESLGKDTKKALVMTEGVVAYLTNEQAEKLSADLYQVHSFFYWIMDYSQGKFRHNRYRRQLDKRMVNAPLQFSEGKPIEFFGRQGWTVEQNIFMLDEADRIGRKLPLKFPESLPMLLFPRKIREMANRTYGYAMFRRN